MELKTFFQGAVILSVMGKLVPALSHQFKIGKKQIIYVNTWLLRLHFEVLNTFVTS